MITSRPGYEVLEYSCGYIYALDRASTGLHVLELTGAARAIAGF